MCKELVATYIQFTYSAKLFPKTPNFTCTEIIIDPYIEIPGGIPCIRYHTCVDSSWPHCTAPPVEEDGTIASK